MKVYLAFAFEDYYPGGGSADLVGHYVSLEAAKEAALAAHGTIREVLEVTEDAAESVWVG